MKELNEFELNEHYKTILDLGFEVKVKTYANNRGIMSLVRCIDKKPIYSVDIKTNGRGTARIMRLLPTTRPLTHLDISLSHLAKFAEDYDATTVRSLSLPGRRLQTKNFVSVFNEANRLHSEEAYAAVAEHLTKDSSAPFSTLIAVYSNEIVNILREQEQG